MRPLWREKGSVIYSTIASGPCQSNHTWAEVPQNSRPYLTVLSETPQTWRARFPYLYPPGRGWDSYTPGHWVPFLSPLTTRGDYGGSSGHWSWRWSYFCGLQSVDRCVWVSGLPLGPLTRCYLALLSSCLTITLFWFQCFLSDEKTVCSLQCNHSLVRVVTHNNYTLPSHLRLCSLFVASYDSQGLRWKYSNPPPHGGSGHYPSSCLLFKTQPNSDQECFFTVIKSKCFSFRFVAQCFLWAQTCSGALLLK
jgi:hypothetical protein